MGKIESWEVTDRTDERMTVLFKRRTYNEETFPQSTGGSRCDKDGLDEETRDVLNKLTHLNKRIRTAFRFDSKNPKNLVTDGSEEKKKKKERMKKSKDESGSSRKNSKKTAEDMDQSSDDTTKPAEETKKTVSSKKQKKVKSEECDHLGVPLSNPMAITPFPGKTTAAKREKARQMLKELATKMYEDDLKKQGKSSTSSKSGKKAKSVKSRSTKKSSSSTGLKSSKNSNKLMGCDKCGSCQKCIVRCSQHHPAEQKVTSAEREEFLKSIKQLRKRIMKPERSREKATKSPYDVTQSVSDTGKSSKSSESKSKKKTKE
ncbi:CXXC-type domain-containing protein [Caenorhabditis elegans]|uniref:CXXC-type domain-containing protein n=1 Tax=Caenorhabditis elegans TaxID=6239 RepID=Q65ZA8_CAEEL|nr:CXXC-type domain-containing protein [Caenorhabditis elegans]CAH19097.1 CXXC-type domain-containing protein [Caenorhabditis elegans]|eukprot:NP_001021451.1 Uncharacterized protein CELE_F36A2.14 [Caenorhabditis elegans]